MKRILVLILVIYFLAAPVNATQFIAPEVTPSGETYMPDETENLGEGLLYIVKAAMKTLYPSFNEALRCCTAVVAMCILLALLSNLATGIHRILIVLGIVIVTLMLMQSANSLILLGVNVLGELSQYGKLLLPVMTAALAAQGSVTQSGVLYSTTAIFNTILATVSTSVLIPLVYILLCMSVVCGINDRQLLKNVKSSLKNIVVWGLKATLYIFTGYITITGVVSGVTDKTMLKATKLTISGMVPVIGGILSDASEALLISAGVMKNAAGIYGILAVIAIVISPFLRIGIQYLMLKITAGFCHTVGTEQIASVVMDFSDVMGIILALISTMSIILLISIICFMRGAT